MKQVFHFCKIIFICFFMLIALPYCNNSSNTKEGNDGDDSEKSLSALEPGVILITGIDAQGQLILKDINGNSVRVRVAKRREVIHWRVRRNSGVKSITEIAMDTHVTPNVDVFSAHPRQQDPDLRHWRGVIKDLDSTKQFEEKYYIKWIDSASSQTHTFDPKIQLNPSFIP